MWVWGDSVVLFLVRVGDVTADVDVGDSGTAVSFVSKYGELESDSVLRVVVGNVAAVVVGVAVDGERVAFVEVVSVVIVVVVVVAVVVVVVSVVCIAVGGCVAICECIVGDDVSVVSDECVGGGDSEAEEDNDDDCSSVVVVASAAVVDDGLDDVDVNIRESSEVMSGSKVVSGMLGEDTSPLPSKVASNKWSPLFGVVSGAVPFVTASSEW